MSSTPPLTFALKNFLPEFAQTPRGDAASLSTSLIYNTLSAAQSSNFPLRGLLLLEAFISFKIFGSSAPYNKEEVYRLLNK